MNEVAATLFAGGWCLLVIVVLGWFFNAIGESTYLNNVAFGKLIVTKTDDAKFIFCVDNINTCEKELQRLNKRGYILMEFKYDDKYGDYQFIEVNPSHKFHLFK